jgi:hypothetical protein
VFPPHDVAPVGLLVGYFCAGRRVADLLTPPPPA